MAASGPGEPTPEAVLDREVSALLERALATGGPAHGLVVRSHQHPGAIDVQLRHIPRERRSWASLYLGLTKVLDVAEQDGAFVLYAHETHRGVGSFDAAWSSPMSWEQLADRSAAIEAYLDAVTSPGAVAHRLIDREGAVQAAVASGRSPHYRVFQREAQVAFTSESVRASHVDPLRDRIRAAIAATGRTDPWWPGVRDRGAVPRLGLKADCLALGADGRLLVIEVKPPNTTKGTAWAPAQVRLYTEVIDLWLRLDAGSQRRLQAMIDQRHRLGLVSPPWPLPPKEELRLAPVIAIGAGRRSPVELDRLGQIAAALDADPPASARIDRLEVWLCDENGHPPTVWLPSQGKAPQ